MDGDENKTRPDARIPEQEPGAAKNIGKVLFLVAALVAAWFVLEWLIEGK